MRWPGRVPPVAVPIRVGDVRTAAAEFHRGDCSARFAAALAEQTAARVARPFSSGRAALSCLLSELARRSPRREVVLPGYACYTLPAAVARAGLRVTLCDVSPDTFDFEPDALGRAVSERTLAVVAVHALGFPADVRAAAGAARGSGAVLVEDCAQLLREDAETVKRVRGDLALLSFGRGKPVTTLGGGALLCFDPIWEDTIEAAAHGLSAPAGQAFGTFMQAAAYSFLTRPLAYRAVEQAPGLEIGVTRFSMEFSISGLSEARAAVGLALLPHLARWNRERQQHADELRAALIGVPGVSLREQSAEAAPLRFPVRVASGRRAEMLRALRRAGLGASPMYPAALAEVPEVRPYLSGEPPPWPGAREVAQTLFTLPCHPAAAGVAPVAAGAIAGVLSPRGGTGRERTPAGETR